MASKTKFFDHPIIAENFALAIVLFGCFTIFTVTVLLPALQAVYDVQSAIGAVVGAVH